MRSYTWTPILQHRCKFAHCPDPLPVYVEEDRHRKEGDTQEPQKTCCPRDAQCVVHTRREQWEASTSQTPNECVPGDSTVRVHEVHVNDVRQTLQKYHHDARADGDSGQDLRNPADVWIACPGEPEETHGEKERANNHGYKTFLWDRLAAVLDHLLLVARLGEVGDDCHAEDDADGDT